LIKSGSIAARFLHKWIGLIVGIQVLIWLASGLYMVIVDLDFIHGDPLVRNMQQTVTIPDSSEVSINSLREQYPQAITVGVRSVMDKTHFTVTTPEERLLIDPVSADIVSPLDEQWARDIAKFHFNGIANIQSARLITSNPPMEIQTRRPPLWRVDFDDRFSTSFYIDPYSGVLVTRRHQYWRIFDFLWMLHIMDYEERMDAHNPLVIFTQIVGVIFAITGLWLLFYSFSRRKYRKGEAS
jgi:uncharacterized iron-regulated membrane protein